MLQGPAGNLSHPAKADVSNKWLVGHSVHTWHLARFFSSTTSYLQGKHTYTPYNKIYHKWFQLLLLKSHRINTLPLLPDSMPKVCTTQNCTLFKSSPAQGEHHQLPEPFLTLHFSRPLIIQTLHLKKFCSPSIHPSHPF